MHQSLEDSEGQIAVPGEQADVSMSEAFEGHWAEEPSDVSSGKRKINETVTSQSDQIEEPAEKLARLKKQREALDAEIEVLENTL